MELTDDCSSPDLFKKKEVLLESDLKQARQIKGAVCSVSPKQNSAVLQACLRFGGIFMCWSDMTAALLK